MLRSGEDARCPYRPGWGGLPSEWLNQDGIRKALREISRRQGTSFTDYGHTAGSPELRTQLHRDLTRLGIPADPGQILTTNGASHGLDLIARLLLRPGDTVLVDDPGYYTLFALLRTLGVNIVGVPRTADGPDLEALEQALAAHSPKAYFVITVLHNPTGGSIAPACAHHLLRLVERFGATVIEDDVYGDFHTDAPLRLAAMDGLRRVVYVKSFSKTLSSGLRLGFLAASPELTSRLMDLKLVSSLTTSVIGEQVMLELRASGQNRRFLGKSQLTGGSGEIVRRRAVQLDLPALRIEPHHPPRLSVGESAELGSVKKTRRSAPGGGERQAPAVGCHGVDPAPQSARRQDLDPMEATLGVPGEAVGEGPAGVDANLPQVVRGVPHPSPRVSNRLSRDRTRSASGSILRARWR